MLQKYLEPEVHYIADRGSEHPRPKDFPQEIRLKKIGIVGGLVINHTGKSLKIFIKFSLLNLMNFQLL